MLRSLQDFVLFAGICGALLGCEALLDFGRFRAEQPSGAGGAASGAGTGGATSGAGSGGTPLPSVCNGNKITYGAPEEIGAKPDGAKRIAIAADSKWVAWLERKDGGVVGELWIYERATKKITMLAGELNNPSSVALGAYQQLEAVYVAELGQPVAGEWEYDGKGQVAYVPAKGGGLARLWDPKIPMDPQEATSSHELVSVPPRDLYLVDLENYPLVARLNTENGSFQEYKPGGAPAPKLLQLAVSSKSLIWATATQISVVDKTTKGIVTLTDVPTPPLDLAADDEMVAWTTDDHRVKGMLLTGAVVLDRASDAPTAVALDGDIVYWLAANGVHKACKKDATTAGLLAPATAPVALRVTSDAVYWSDGDGRIKRIAKSSGP